MMDYQSKKARLLSVLPEILRSITPSHGEFTLFALLERENSTGPWDIVVSAPWVGESIKPVIDLIFDNLRKYLSQEEMLTISRVVVLRPDEPFIKEFLVYMRQQRQTNPLYYEFVNEEFYGIEFRRGYVFQWNEQSQPVHKSAQQSAA